MIIVSVWWSFCSGTALVKVCEFLGAVSKELYSMNVKAMGGGFSKLKEVKKIIEGSTETKSHFISAKLILSEKCKDPSSNLVVSNLYLGPHISSDEASK